MSLIKRRISTIVLAQLLILASASGQQMYEMKFAGKLADIQGKAICNEAFNLSVQLTREGDYNILFEIDTTASSDDEGWFEYSISEISQYLLKEYGHTHPVVIKMELLPNEKTKWMKEGEDFMVSYTLKPAQDSINNQLTMTRLEGSTLLKHTEDHLLAFKDLDPFSYLLGGFLITDHPPMGDQSTSDLKQWLSPEDQDIEGGVSRGVKGSFPSGGYKHKK
jgi:hypothetical protein